MYKTGNLLIDALINRKDTPDILGLAPHLGTPAYNPGAPDPRVQQQQTKPSMFGKVDNAFDKVDSFLNRPGGSMLMNLLAQEGYSTMPSSPFGAIGRAYGATQQQDLQRRFIESQIGLNQFKGLGELMGGDGMKPLTDMAKLESDFRNGLIDKPIYEARRGELLGQARRQGFADTQSLRGEYSTAIKPTQQSLQSLASASTLIQTSQNPIADLAAFISTIKSIDNSTVREGELAAFNSIQGLARELENMLTKAKGEGFSAPMRKDIAETINKLSEPLRQHYQAQKKFFADEASRFEINPESVVGGGILDAGPIDLNQPMFNAPNQPTPPQRPDTAQLEAEIAALEAEIAQLEKSNGR